MKKSVDEKSAERGRGGEERHELVWRLWGMKEVCTESTEKEVEIPVDEKERQCEDRKQSAKWEGEKMRGEEGEREEREGRKEGTCATQRQGKNTAYPKGLFSSSIIPKLPYPLHNIFLLHPA